MVPPVRWEEPKSEKARKWTRQGDTIPDVEWRADAADGSGWREGRASASNECGLCNKRRVDGTMPRSGTAQVESRR